MSGGGVNSLVANPADTVLAKKRNYMARNFIVNWNINQNFMRLPKLLFSNPTATT